METKKNIKNSFKAKNIYNILNYTLHYEEFNENINEEYLLLQNKFCEKENENINQDIEHKIRITNAHFNGKDFELFVYKDYDALCNSLVLRGKLKIR